jgi:hypothetical protein
MGYIKNMNRRYTGMKDIYLLNYSVKGVKTLDQLVSLSFYKKTISKELDTQKYNIKGIYGMNGSGKSGIITSVEILKNLITNSGYLNNPIVQKNLDEIINKKTNELFIETEYLAKLGSGLFIYKYSVTLSKDNMGKYIISHECLSYRKATSRKEPMETIFEIFKGEDIIFYKNEEHDKISRDILKKTMNLLSSASMSALFSEKILIPAAKQSKEIKGFLFVSICTLYILGKKIYVYLDQSDDHREYVTRNSLEIYHDKVKNEDEINSLMISFLEMNNDCFEEISVSENWVYEEEYGKFEKTINALYDFLHIFKSDLRGIEIDRKENHNFWICDLVMVYESYKIHAEYESTGIKKLMKLYMYLKEMVHGGIVFIDEFDSNLHDVYLCALLEYLMEYGEGQLCFTTHNVGPMDVLKQRKKSIDFLSEDHKIYPWTKSGNYSPSKLYRNGMIEGSPFNVDSIDFIGVFGSDEGDE